MENSGAYQYEYFLEDHLGNTRIRCREKDSEPYVQQESHYYPFGLQFEGTYNQIIEGENKYLYNGKELQDELLGGINLDWLDYGARMYDPALGRWHTQDPLAEFASPYVYVGNNPTNMIDPFGLASAQFSDRFDNRGSIIDDLKIEQGCELEWTTGYTVDKDGYFNPVNNEGGNHYDVIYPEDMYSEATKKDYDKSGKKTGLQISKGILNNKQTGESSGSPYDYYSIRDNQTATTLFKFVANNSNVEWSHLSFGTSGNYLSTSHNPSTDFGGVDLLYTLATTKNFPSISFTHSHPNSKGLKTFYGPSGFKQDLGKTGDKYVAEWFNQQFPNQQISWSVYDAQLRWSVKYNKDKIIYKW